MSPSSAASSPNSSPESRRTRPTVQALLDQLSDSDTESVVQKRVNPAQKSLQTVHAATQEEQDSSEDEIVLGRGRLANRLAGDAPTTESMAASDSESASTETSKGKPSSETRSSPRPKDSENDSTNTLKTGKRLLLKRKRVPEESPHTDDPQAPETPSPPHRTSRSPILQRDNSQPTSPSAAQDQPASTDRPSKPKFTALVEKARQARLAREAAEEAKKQARAAREAEQAVQAVPTPKRRGQRGSSPADDSEEDSDPSDNPTAQRLTKDARPTRKASKKAIEEMNRETQRMNRNMQLAHQAKTKKKFTKESFLASFNRVEPTLPPVIEAQSISNAVSTSTASSDSEMAKLHSTPPTSPLLEPEKSAPQVIEAPLQDNEARQAGVDEDDDEDFMSLLASRKAVDYAQAAPKVANNQPADVTLSSSESESDIEIIFDKASRRKYVAFENLPRRKAHGAASHLALRSLAHIKPEKHVSGINSANMSSNLLRAARLQALEERREKIEALRARGIEIETVEQREQAEAEAEDLWERRRQEELEIARREKELAKKNGTYIKDVLDEDDDSDDDSDFNSQESGDDAQSESDEDEAEGSEADAEADGDAEMGNAMIDDAAEESEEETEEAAENPEEVAKSKDEVNENIMQTPMPARSMRASRLVIEDDDEDESQPVQVAQSPALPSARKTPQSILRSARKIIPGLHHSDELDIGLTQAFAATMADSQTQQEPTTQDQDSMDILHDLPSPQINMIPRLNRLESLDIISESVAGSQTQPLELDLGMSQSQRVPESPSMNSQFGQSQPFVLTQDAGYRYSPFTGNRFETPSREPHSTEETVIVPQVEESPIAQRRGRLQRGQIAADHEEEEENPVRRSAFQLMSKAAKRKLAVEEFDKKKSEARQAFDEAAEESDDEYAGLGGISDEDSGEEDEDDRRMIDEDTQVGKGDEAKLAKFHQDRVLEDDKRDTAQLQHAIETGGLRKRGRDEFELDGDQDDATARRQRAKRKEFARLTRELRKDEAINKIADNKRKEAFFKSLQDHENDSDGEDTIEIADMSTEETSQSQSAGEAATGDSQTKTNALKPISASDLNSSNIKGIMSRKTEVNEIRRVVSFLIEEPDSQTSTPGEANSDDEEEHSYVDLDRHIAQAEADENALEDDADDLGDFIVDDETLDAPNNDEPFKRPALPAKGGDRLPFSERRTKPQVQVVDRLSLLRQQSSSTSTSTSGSTVSTTSKMAFVARSSSTGGPAMFSATSLLKRATTNSSIGSITSRDNVSATGVVTSSSRTERGGAAQEKEFVRKGSNSARNAINYQGRKSLKEEKMSERAGVGKRQMVKAKGKGSGGGGFLKGLFGRGETWG